MLSFHFVVFTDWKITEERRRRCNFVLLNGIKKLANGVKKRYFRCHRSGNFKSEGSQKRRLKAQGSCKINAFCPAAIDLSEAVFAEDAGAAADEPISASTDEAAEDAADEVPAAEPED